MNVSGVTSGGALSSSVSQTTMQGMNTQDFLNLMVAQMQYQDPLSPMENSDFMAQWAQLSVLEELQLMNQALTELTSKLGGSETDELLQASALVGRTIEANPSGSDGVVSGIVSEVRVNDGVPTLIVDGIAIALEDITRIS